MCERDIVERLSSLVTDWDGSDMKDGEPPIDDIRCLDLRQAAAEILRLRAQVAALLEVKDAVEHVNNNRQVVRETMMDAVLGPTYITHGISWNRVHAALSAYAAIEETLP